LRDEATTEDVDDTLNEPNNNDIDEKMIEHKNLDLHAPFLLLKKISDEEFEALTHETVLKRMA